MNAKVKDPISAVANVDDYSGSARLLAATTLRWSIDAIQLQLDKFEQMKLRSSPK